MRNPRFPYTSAARLGAPDTSVAAGAAHEENAWTIRAKCLTFIRSCRRFGATTDEGAEAVGLSNHYASRPRFSELRAAGLIFDSGFRRKGRSGRSTVVWVAREYAVASAVKEDRHG